MAENINQTTHVLVSWWIVTGFSELRFQDYQQKMENTNQTRHALVSWWIVTGFSENPWWMPWEKNINQPQPLNNKLESVIDIPENKPNVTGFPRNPSHFVVVWWPLWCDAFSEVSRRTPEFEVWRVFWKTLDDLGWPAGISIKRWRVLARRDFAKPYLFTNQSNYEFGIVNKDPTKEHGLMLVHHSLGEGILEFWQ